MKIAKYATIALLGLSTSVFASDIEDNAKVLEAFDQAKNYEIYITSPTCPPCRQLEAYLTETEMSPEATITVDQEDEYDALRQGFSERGLNPPPGYPVIIDKVDGEVNYYVGFILYKGNGFMLKIDSMPKDGIVCGEQTYLGEILD